MTPDDRDFGSIVADIALAHVDEGQRLILSATIAMHRELTSRLGRIESHLESEAGHRAQEIREAREAGRAEHHAVHAEHLQTHHWYQPRRASDPADVDFTKLRGDGHTHTPLEAETERQHWLLWMVASKGGILLVGALAALITIALNLLVYGRP